jgi:hypothetical protein
MLEAQECKVGQFSDFSRVGQGDAKIHISDYRRDILVGVLPPEMFIVYSSVPKDGRDGGLAHPPATSNWAEVKGWKCTAIATLYRLLQAVGSGQGQRGVKSPRLR